MTLYQKFFSKLQYVGPIRPYHVVFYRANLAWRYFLPLTYLSAIDFSDVSPCVYIDAFIRIFKQHDGVEYITSFRNLVSEYISHIRGLAIVVIYFKILPHMLISHQSETCTLCNNLVQKIYQYRLHHMPGRAFFSYVLVRLLCLDK